MSKVRTRFAPSPTGRMHVGNLRTALYAYLIAKHEDGDFLLRIEDTDQERYVEGAVDIIYRTMKEAGLEHDEGPDKDGGVGPYVQSERQAAGIYMEYAKKLIEKGEAYYCFCDKERLESLKTEVAGKEIVVYDKHCLHLSKEEVDAKLAAGVPFVIRQNNPTTGTTTFHDDIYGDITVDNAELDDMILIKSDGYPTYNFANVVDDHLMGITHVVRGNEYLSSSPKYNRLYEAFGWEVPVYVHCPLITDEEHKKLSKRCGHSSFEDLLEQGFLPEAIINFVALLGWSPDEDREIYSLDELIKAFDYHHISKAPSVFDYTKLKWMNGEYIKAMDFDKFYERALPILKETIHRDLEKLEIEGFVKRTYGGAVLNKNKNVDMPLRIREKTNRDEKQIIAGLVAGLVEEGDRIMLDASSTSLMIAKELKEMNKLTVITNSVEVLIELAGHEGIQVISTGGNLNESSLSLVGNAAQKVLNGYHVDKAIFSCKGIDMKEGMTDSNELDSDIKIAMYNCADTAILAVDSSKFDRVSFVKSMMLKKGDVIVTDRKPSAEWLSFLEEQGVHLVTQE